MIAYATDEDLAIRAPADFWALCPKDQIAAAGSDGLLLATDPWTLRSPSVDFTAAGLAPGQVIRLTGQAGSGVQGELYAVASVGPGGLTLRQKGQDLSTGRPPSAGFGVEFVVRTLTPQLNRASQDLNCRFGIDEAVVGRRSSDLRDHRGLLDATVLTVLSRQYLDQARRFTGAADEAADWYGTKARLLKAELDDLLNRLVLQWAESTDSSLSVVAPRFVTRLSR